MADTIDRRTEPGVPPPPDPPAGADGAGDGDHRFPTPSRRQVILTLVAVAVLVVAGTLAIARHRSAGSSTSSVASFMGLTPLPGIPAVNLTLTDQHGRTLSLRSLRGKAVVLEFMDPHCTNICPIVAQEFADAWRDLGTRANRVAFVAVNANPYHTTVADVAAFTDHQGLQRIPAWHFLTGPVPTLRAAWKAYRITVVAPSPTADVQHSDTMYFIGPSGRERFVANPVDEQTPNGTAFLPVPQIREWGQGIATYAGQLAG